MGQVNTEQAVRIFESGANSAREAVEVVASTIPEPEPTNYWFLFLIAVVPAIITAFTTVWIKNKQMSRKK